MFIEYENYDRAVEIKKYNEIKNKYDLNDENIAKILGVNLIDIEKFKESDFISEEIFMKLGILHEFSKVSIYQKIADVLQGVNVQLGIPYDCISKLSGVDIKIVEDINRLDTDLLDDKDFLKIATSLIVLLSLGNACA